MTPQQALNVLDDALAPLKLSRKEHEVLVSALNLLSEQIIQPTENTPEQPSEGGVPATLPGPIQPTE